MSEDQTIEKSYRFTLWELDELNRLDEAGRRRALLQARIGVLEEPCQMKRREMETAGLSVVVLGSKYEEFENLQPKEGHPYIELKLTQWLRVAPAASTLMEAV